MLTVEDMAILKRPFAPQHHEFLKGNAYITEMAITERIEQVDPSWSLEQITLYKRDGLSMQTVCTMRLTIKGVSRDGVGMAVIVPTKSKDGKSEVGEANEAEKSAATDALKRAARLFGIGRYLLDLPPSVVDEKSMAKYLSTLKQPSPTTPAPSATVDVSTGEIVDAPIPVPSVVNPTPAKPENRAAELQNELVAIERIEPVKIIGQSRWNGIAHIADPKMPGLNHKVNITLWEEDKRALEQAGYEWLENQPVYIPVYIDTTDRNMIRINRNDIPAPEKPKSNPFNGALVQSQAAAPETAQKPTSGDPDWFSKPLKEAFGVFKGYVLENVYGKNTYHMNNSLKKHGVTDAKGNFTEAWGNKTIAEAVAILNAERSKALPEAS